MIGRLSIRGRLALLTLIAIIALLSFAAVSIHDRNRIYNEATELRRAVTITASTSALVHEIQRERGLAAAAIGARGKSGDDRFGQRLQAQYEVTDTRLEDVEKQTVYIEGDTYTRELRNRLKRALGSVADLAAWRERTLNDRLSLDGLLNLYTNANAQLIDVVAHLPRLSTNADIATIATAAIQIINAKEKAGLERAVLANAFAADQFSPGMLGVVVALISAQDAYLNSFQQHATPEQRGFFRDRMEGLFADEVERMRELAIAGAAGEGFGVAPAHWFEMMSARIDQMQTVENRLLDDLRAKARQLASGARHSLTFTGFVAVIVVTVTLLLAYLLSRQILGQVATLQGTIRSIRSGADLRKRIKVTSRDELGSALEAFNDMLDELSQADMGSRTKLAAKLRRQAEQLAEADQRKDQFLAMLAHELRNPLAPIAHVIKTLERERAGLGREARKGLQVMERQVDHMSTLVDDLLDVARITHGRLELRKAPMVLTTVLSHAVEVVKPVMEAKGQRFHADIYNTATYAEIDPVRLSQIVTNLLSNAAKYTAEGGEIWLTLGRDGDEAVITVRDTGIGIDAQLLPHVFDVFTQAERRLDRSEGGLGIGLSLVRELTEMHGGRVAAFSDGHGRGSRFEVRIPALQEVPALDIPAKAGEEPAIEAPVPRRVLIVEDNVDAASSLATLLRAMGHTVHAAHDGVAAVEAMPMLRPEIVILDIGLPEMDGYQVARHLRETYGDDIALIALTGYGSEEARHTSSEVGFDHHLVKPVDPVVLQRLLANPSGEPSAGESSAASAG